MALCPRKYLIKDIINKPVPTDVWLQGTIEQIFESYYILSDTFGRAKITNCDTADGIVDKNSLRKGTYCCILGKTIKTDGLPEVQASKFVDLTSQPQMKMAWETEVRDANLFLEGKILPIIK